MNKKLVSILCLLLCFTMSAVLFVGCNDEDEDEAIVGTVDGKGEERFANADFSGTTIKILMSNYEGGMRSTEVAKYMTGTDTVTSDNILIAVNDRNAYVKEKLKLDDVTYSYIDDGWDTTYKTVHNLYSSNENVPDALALPDALVQLMMADIFMNCNTSSDTNYFDFTDGSWYTDAMSVYALGNDVTKSDTGVYILASDYFIDYIRTIAAIFVNEEVLTSHTPWTTEELYEYVTNGEWTWDVLMAISDVVFEDHQDPNLNRNGYLYASSTAYGFSADAGMQHTYAADLGIMIYENGRYSYDGNAINSKLSAFADKMLQLKNKKSSVDILTGDVDGINRIVYAKDNTLFSIFHLYDLESDSFSALKVCPVVIPKLNIEDNYKANGEGSLGAIFNSTSNFEEISAYWQYMSVMSTKTRVVYYEDGLGLKYETGENTKDMLDIIYASMRSDPTFIWDLHLNLNVNRDAISFYKMVSNTMAYGSNTVTSDWAKVIDVKNEALNDVIVKYNKLQK